MRIRKYHFILLASIVFLTACPMADEEVEVQEEFVGVFLMESFSLSSRRSFINSEGEEIGLLQSEDQSQSSEYYVEFFEDGTFYGEGPIVINSDVIDQGGTYMKTYGNGEFRRTTEGTWKVEDDQLKTTNDDWVFQVMTNLTRINYPEYFCFNIISMNEDEIFLGIDILIDFTPASGLNEDRMKRTGSILLTRLI
ncbi:MAG: hypothetical protein HKN68_20050 [Saprospiraceae bacterium]|nr:hypothetical protein [Saprospiraceae bacterium]